MESPYSIGQIVRYTLVSIVIAITGKAIGGFVGNPIFILFSFGAGLSINEIIKKWFESRTIATR